MTHASRSDASGRTYEPPPARRREKLSILLAGLALACSATGPGENGTLPPSVQDPAVVKTASGALGFYRAVVTSVPALTDDLVFSTGTMTDELAALPAAVGASSVFTAVDSRQRLVDGEFGNLVSAIRANPYSRLHKLRGQAREARGFLSAYLPDGSAALRGHLYALEGYADVFLADIFCSGIPLSTVDFGADYTLAPGSSRDEVYTAAAGLFDSALALTGDSLRLRQLAAVGRGRALLALGSYDSAAAAVAAVPTDFRYDVVYAGSVTAPSLLTSVLFEFQSSAPNSVALPGMGDREGRNGLDYVSSGDPRTPVFVTEERDAFGNALPFPAKYPTSDPTTFVVASGIEARLIEAEAALQAGSGEWLTKLNALRQTVGLADTTDPGAPAARVDLLFRERAFWLYLTGHRQGDLRRLIRQYGRARSDVYPWGNYLGGTGLYGPEIVVPVPESEQQYNPNYTGCNNRDA